MMVAMPSEFPLPRSAEQMSRHDTGLLVVDVQEKLIGAIADHDIVVWNIGRLLDAAETLGIPAAGTEQYPQGLGPTVPELVTRLGTVPSKLSFSCGQCASLFADFRQRDIHRLLLAGIETHVCVQQTALDLLAAGFQVYLAVDAAGSRRRFDHEIALRRMESSGVTLTTTESVLFEWCERAGSPEFKKISALAKLSGPRPKP